MARFKRALRHAVILSVPPAVPRLFLLTSVDNIIKDYTNLANTGKTIILCRIPSHVNIRGNERVDAAAKSALSLLITNMKLPARELIPCVSKFCFDEWQDIWDCCEGNKLHSIYPTVGSSIPSILRIQAFSRYGPDKHLRQRATCIHILVSTQKLALRDTS